MPERNDLYSDPVYRTGCRKLFQSLIPESVRCTIPNKRSLRCLYPIVASYMGAPRAVGPGSRAVAV
jgi:hypothetical protein